MTMLLYPFEISVAYLESVLQYIMKEVSYPKLMSSFPERTRSPPYHKTIRIPMFGRRTVMAK